MLGDASMIYPWRERLSVILRGGICFFVLRLDDGRKRRNIRLRLVQVFVTSLPRRFQAIHPQSFHSYNDVVVVGVSIHMII